MASWLVAALGVSVVAAALAFVPLFDLLAFEFSVCMGAVLAYFAGLRACGFAGRVRQPPAPVGFPGAMLLRAGVENLLLALLPLGIISANSLRVPNCNWGEGLLFYGLFVVPGILYGTTLGFTLGLWAPVRRARWLFIAWSLATYAYVLWNVIVDPPIFAFNAFVGYFPGPLYDQVVQLSARLLLARICVLLEAGIFALAGVVLWNGRGLGLRAARTPWSGARAVAAPLLLAFGLVFAILIANADRLGFRPTRDSVRRALGGHIATAHCDVFYDVQAYTRPRAEELAREHEFHYSELRRFFGFDVPGRIGSYVYATAEKKKRLMGAAGTSFEDALSDEFHLNAASWPHPVLRHEMAHIFAAHLDRWWPICPQIGIHEGIAVAAEWGEESGRLGLTPDEACAAMDTLGLLPDLEKILGAFGFWTQPGARAYTAAGSFVHFLVTTHGMDDFRRLWSSRDFERTYGANLRDLVQQWRQARLDPVRLTPLQMRRAERLYRPPAVFAIPCAHEQARINAAIQTAQQAQQFTVAESLYTQLLELDPGDPGLVVSLARTRLLAGRPEAAERDLSQLLDEPELAPAWRSRALDERGDQLWQLGRVAEAESCFAAAAREATSRAERRAAALTVQVLRTPALVDALRPILSETAPETGALVMLAWVRGTQPDSAIPRYLLGRRLYYAERFEEAASELEPLTRNPELGPDARLASLELLALADLRAGHPERVPSRLLGLAEFDLDSAEQLGFAGIASRAAWAETAAGSSGGGPP
ncbi:MAG TPA: tetratricopeptide repeat protein [Candidatus Krumholzibacteria bacterium]|nr:tetratricopeptide repeat protein [Candidatus Krumholzibacteria bacterium]